MSKQYQEVIRDLKLKVYCWELSNSSSSLAGFTIKEKKKIMFCHMNPEEDHKNDPRDKILIILYEMALTLFLYLL